MSTPSRTWHADPDALRGWVQGDAGPLVSASVEQHVLSCAQCRADVARLTATEPPAALDAVWQAVLTTVEAPRTSRAERWLNRLGLSPADSLVVVTAISMRGSWLAGVAGVLAFAVLASLLGSSGVGLFLLAAPLLPVVGVAAAYGPASDPSYDAVLAAPYSMFRLMMLRTAAVILTTGPLAVAAGLLLPGSAAIAVVWLLPALGFVAVVLLASSWTDPAYAATGIGVGWCAFVIWAGAVGDPLRVVSAPELVCYAALLVVGTCGLAQRLLTSVPSWRLR